MAMKLSFPSKVEILSHISLHENGGYVLTPRNAWVLTSFNLTILSLQRKRRRHCSKLFTDEKFSNIFSVLLFCYVKIIWKQTSPPRGDEWAEEIPIPIKARLIRIRNREEYNQNKKGNLSKGCEYTFTQEQKKQIIRKMRISGEHDIKWTEITCIPFD